MMWTVNESRITVTSGETSNTNNKQPNVTKMVLAGTPKNVNPLLRAFLADCFNALIFASIICSLINEARF